MENQSVSEFILLGFQIGRPLELLLAFFFFAMYIGSLGNNSIIIYITLIDNRLRTGMYFFIGNFGVLDVFFTFVTTPKLLWNLFTGDKSISFSGCIAQSYFFFLLGTVELLQLATMSYDRYVAVCHPLHYHAIMNSQTCIYFIVGCWAGGFFSVLIPTIMISRLPFCKSNIINHFFCDSGPLLILSCSDTRLIELINFMLSFVVILFCSVLTLVTYVFIISATLRISTNSGRAKVFNTCVSHLTMILVGFGINIFIYVTPSQKETLNVRKIPAVLTTVISPFLNPFIFTLKNDAVQQILKEMLKCSPPKGNKQYK